MHPLLNRISVCATVLLMRWAFYGALCFKLQPVVDESIGTAGTDGTRVWFAPSYCDKLTERQLVGLIAHEILHCALLHMLRLNGRDPELWNLACDYVIDQILVDAGFEVPDATVNPAWRGWTAEMIYEELLKQQKQTGKKPSGGKGDKLIAPKDDAEAKTLQSGWEEAVQAAVMLTKGKGDLPAGLDMAIKQITEARVDWRSEMRRFTQQTAKNDYSWSRPNRRWLGAGFVLPSMYSERLPPVVFVRDTSGSLWSPACQSIFNKECDSLIAECNPEATHVLQVDARLQDARTFESGDEIDLGSIKGGGGTSFVPAFDWVEEQGIEPACLIYLTDMDGTFPKQAPSYPVLWASTVKGKKAPFGEVLYIDMEQRP